jgi:predicted nuclease of predicted toxin-antitoxin system
LKVLLDEDVPRKLVPFLAGNQIQTVVSMEWGGIKNGELLALIEREGFEVFITGDKNMSSQQQLEGRPFAALIMSAINWPVVKPHVEKIAAAVSAAQPGALTLIDCGVFVPRSKSKNT